jgi:hypothetical protein
MPDPVQSKKKYVDCWCSHPSHTIRFTYDTDDPDIPLYVAVQMANCLPFWKRLVEAVRYVFNLEPRFGHGHWDETLIYPGDIASLIVLFQKAQAEASSTYQDSSQQSS